MFYYESWIYLDMSYSNNIAEGMYDAVLCPGTSTWSQDPLQTTPSSWGSHNVPKRIKPIEDLFSECFIMNHGFIWTCLIVIILQRGCMMLFYAQEPLPGLRTHSKPRLLLGVPTMYQKE